MADHPVVDAIIDATEPFRASGFSNDDIVVQVSPERYSELRRNHPHFGAVETTGEDTVRYDGMSVSPNGDVPDSDVFAVAERESDTDPLYNVEEIDDDED